MAKTIPVTDEEFIEAIAEELGDTDNKVVQDGTVMKGFIADALERFSKDRPLEDVHDFAGNGTTFEIDLSATLTGWDDDLSKITAIEHPTGERPPNFWDDEDWLIRREDVTVSGEVVPHTWIQFIDTTPDTGETARIYYTRRHRIQIIGSTQAPNATTIPESARRAFVFLACYFAARKLSRLYANETDRNIGAEILNFDDKSLAWRNNARDLMEQYTESLPPLKSGGRSFPIDFRGGLGRKPFSHQVWQPTKRR